MRGAAPMVLESAATASLSKSLKVFRQTVAGRVNTDWTTSPVAEGGDEEHGLCWRDQRRAVRR